MGILLRNETSIVMLMVSRITASNEPLIKSLAGESVGASSTSK
jgi:hypothetical protein